ncbi:MAG: hypothetical protein CM1200mP14_14170 [Gammaproteobacteria bacterium]|nr:MAG: hypothetical protein CM1200mP14_14170 [Gammaproteobacteria bacterium]
MDQPYPQMEVQSNYPGATWLVHTDPTNGDKARPGTVVAIDTNTRSVIAVIEVGRYAAGMSVTSSMNRN